MQVAKGWDDMNTTLDQGVALLQDLSKEELIAIIVDDAKNWLAHDGLWFQAVDQKYGMEKQMNTLSTLGLLSHFVGMLTDSRSFLSFPRHEYFRRILCNLLGTDAEKGLIPSDMARLGQIVENISYHNARNYFGFIS